MFLRLQVQCRAICINFDAACYCQCDSHSCRIALTSPPALEVADILRDRAGGVASS